MILIIGYGDVELVVNFMCDGVYDFVEKLFFLSWLVDMVWWVLDKW